MSEFYAFVYILGNRVVELVDGHLQLLGQQATFLRVFRNDGITYQFTPNGSLKIVHQNGITSKVSRSVVRNHADQLFKLISEDKSISTNSPEIIQLKQLLQTQKLTAKCTDKSDFQGDVITANQTLSHTLGFSVKSHVGSPPTLINPSKRNSLLYYKVVPINGKLTPKHKAQLQKIANTNCPTNGEKLPETRDYIDQLKHYGFKLQFEKTAEEALGYTLRIIDTNFANILGEVLLENYTYPKASKQERRKTLGQLVELCCKRSKLSSTFAVLGNNSDEVLCSVRYKMQNFLLAFSTGATIATKWDGRDLANGGFIIVLKNGQVVCLELFTRNAIGEYLLENTVFDTPSRSRHGGGQLEKIGDDWYFGLQLQVRFDQR